MKTTLTAIFLVLVFTINSFPYGNQGHSIVGAIADRRLAGDTAVMNQINAILHGLTLEKAAVIPDTIKARWDHCNDPCKKPALVSNPGVNAELLAFFNANRPGSSRSHHEFHYTDVPVVGSEKYNDGAIGRADDDIVKMISFCIQVLKGQQPTANKYAITKAVAIILLAHYLGDIHQPLHVGAQYFDKDRNTVNPAPGSTYYTDQGGNKLTLYTFQNQQLRQAGNNMHNYWDEQTVINAFGGNTPSASAQSLAAHEPVGWKLNNDIGTWAEQMADNILPAAREAHTRLSFSQISLPSHPGDIKSGRAEENPKKPGVDFFAIWAAGVVKQEIHKGGWQLAEILRTVFSAS